MAMQSRKDLLHAHRLMTQRAALALLRGEPDVPDQPLRRLNVGTFAGILVGVIVAGIFGIWGLLDHGAPGLQKEASVIIDKQTNADYVWCGPRANPYQTICPEVNFASALLAVGTPSAPIQEVNQSSLSGIPLGPVLGIPDLPPDLPTPSLLIKQPWSACTQSSFGVGGQKFQTVLAGGFQTGGQSIGSSVLLVSSGGTDYVIGNDLRMPIQQQTMTQLFPTTTPVLVSPVWLNAVPLGAMFAAPQLPGQGTLVQGPTGATVQVGTLFQNGATPPQYFVTTQNGLAPITQTQESLLALMQGDVNGSGPTTLSPSQLTHVIQPLPTDGLPPTDKSAVPASSTSELCVVYSGSDQNPVMQVETGGQMPTGGLPTGALPGSVLAAQVALNGEGALVKETGNSISYFLITDGHRYALGSNSVPAALGYNSSQAVQLPASFVDLIPEGPGFDPVQANEPVASGG